MISAEEFVDLLEQRDLLSADMIVYLRKQVAQARLGIGEPPYNKSLTAPVLAKWLVDNGYLSRLLAQRLLDRAQSLPEKPPPSSTSGVSPQPSSSVPPPAPSQPPPPRDKAKGEERRPVPSADDDLELAPIDDEKREDDGDDLGLILDEPGDESDDGLIPLDDDDELIPLDDAAPSQPVLPPRPVPPRAPPVRGAPARPVTPIPTAAPVAPPAEVSPSQPAALAEPLWGPAVVGDKHERIPAKRRPASIWDTPLILAGGGGLLLLVIVAVVLIWVLTRGSADQKLQASNEFYDQGSYSSAIRNYSEFIEQYPNHESVSFAKVRRGLAQLRQRTEKTTDWSAALDTAKTVIPQISGEPEFAQQARPELASLLPDIADGLAKQAHEKRDPQLVAKARECLALVDKYVIKSKQPATRLTEIQGLLAITDREIARDAELRKTIAAMERSRDAGRTSEAYQARRALLRLYPDLDGNESLVEAVKAVSRAEQEAVKAVAEARAAETSDVAAPILSTTVLAARSGDGGVPGAKGKCALVFAEGAVYGLDAESGRVLWRRHVGMATDGRTLRVLPTALAEGEGSDALLVDADRNEVLRVEGTTGKLRWRHAVNERFDSSPTVAAGQAFVGTRNGRLLFIDLRSGNSDGYVQMPQELRTAPAYDSEHSLIYQVADHTNLFVISGIDRKCRQVAYLGHEPGSISVPPVLLGRFLLVAENHGAETSRLRVLSLEDGEGQPRVEQVQEIELPGRIDLAPLVAGVRVVVTTDRGELRLFEITAADAERPLVPIAEGRAAGEEVAASVQATAGLIRFPLLRSERLWVADSQLTRYEVLVSRNRLQPKGIENERTVALEPLTEIGSAVLHVRRAVGLPGVIVSAERDEGGPPYWETRLAAPLAAEPKVDGESGKTLAANALGSVFDFELSVVGDQQVVDVPAASPRESEMKQPVTAVVPLAGGVLALAGGGDGNQVFLFDRSATPPERWLPLPDALATIPVGLGDGLLAPCVSGQALLVDLQLGNRQVEPFQPPLIKGKPPQWLPPVVVADREFVLAARHGGLYRVAVRAEPTPHLAAIAAADWPRPLTAAPAALGMAVYLVDAAPALSAVNAADFKAVQQWPLSGRCAWGPRVIGGRVYLATDDDQLYCIEKDKLVWRVPLSYGPLAGAPLEAGDHVLVASIGGAVVRLDGANGKELARVDLEVPLGSGPVRVGEQLLVAGHDGVLFRVKQP